MRGEYLVSILVPVYRVEKYIERCVVSLFEQTYNDIEYIFVDDCSPDQSVNILKSVIKRYPQREKSITIVEHAFNKGLAGARNTALAAAKGDFVMHVDSDDFIERKAVEFFVAKQLETNADIVSCEVKIILPRNGLKFFYMNNYKNGSELTKAILRFDVRPSVWGRLIRRSLYIDNNILCKEGYDMAEDFQVMPRLSYYAQKVAMVKKYLYFYDKTNEGSITYSFPMKNIAQSRFAYEMLNTFFSQKDPSYIEALYFGQAIDCIRSIVMICDTGIGNDEYYKAKCEILSSIDSQYLKKLSIPYKIVAKLINHRGILTFFVGIMEPINKLIKKIKK